MKRTLSTIALIIATTLWASAQTKGQIFENADGTTTLPAAGVSNAQLAGSIAISKLASVSTIGTNLLTLTNPGAVTYLRMNADNTATARSAAQMLSDLGAQASGSYLVAGDIGSTVQAYDADLSIYAGISPSANVQTLLATANFAAFRTSLGTVIGTDVEAHDPDLTTIAGLSPTTDNFIVAVSSAWASRTPTQVRTTLSVNNVENTALSTWTGSTTITSIGATTVTATTPSITTASGQTNTGFFQVNGKTSGALKLTAADAAAQTVTINLAAQTTGAATLTIPDRAGASGTFAFTDVTALSSLVTVSTIGTGVWQGTVVGSTYGGTGINNAGRTLTINTNSGTLAFGASSKTLTVSNSLTLAGTDGTTQTMPTNTATIPGRVGVADIAAGTSAVSATTLFTPTVSGWYRISAFLKITTTGTSPVAGPITITYTDPDGSVAQSEVMLLHSTTGAVVTNTVNNSTTTGTVSGTLLIYAKTGVAIQYAIAVSGTYGAGRYVGHLSCEALQ